MDLGNIYFDIKHRGFSRVFVTRPEPCQIGVCLKVKNSTYHSTWVFFPSKAFMAVQDKSYERFCFGNSRKVAVDNFINGVHRRFQTCAEKPWMRNVWAGSAASSEEVAE